MVPGCWGVTPHLQPSNQAAQGWSKFAGLGTELASAHRNTALRHFPLPWLLRPKMLGVWAWSPAEMTAGPGQGTATVPAASRTACGRDRQRENENQRPSLPPMCFHPATHCLWCFTSKIFFSSFISLLIYRTQKAGGFLCRGTN